MIRQSGTTLLIQTSLISGTLVGTRAATQHSSWQSTMAGSCRGLIKGHFVDEFGNTISGGPQYNLTHWEVSHALWVVN